MHNIKAYIIYRKYIDELLKNQNLTTSPVLQDIFTKSDYESLLKPVLKVIEDNPHANLTTLRFLLFKNILLFFSLLCNIFWNETFFHKIVQKRNQKADNSASNKTNSL